MKIAVPTIPFVLLALAAPALAADEPAAKNAGGTQNAPVPGNTPRGEDNIGQGEDFKKDVARRITIEDLQKRVSNGTPVVFVDTRGAAAGPVPKGAMHLTGDQLEAWAKNRDKRTLIVTYCT